MKKRLTHVLSTCDYFTEEIACLDNGDCTITAKQRGWSATPLVTGSVILHSETLADWFGEDAVIALGERIAKEGKCEE